MIKNIIFDMGNVLLKYDPDLFIRREGIDYGSDYDMLMNEVFLAPEWSMMDMGLIAEPQMEQKVLSVLPERLHCFARKFIYNWEDPVIPIEGMSDLVKECKEMGYGIFLLSNASVRQPEYWNKIPGHEFFDDTLVSAFVKMVKPNPEIFRLAAKKFSVDPEQCIFVDDLLKNTQGAEASGMKSFHFVGDVNALRNVLIR